MKPPLDRKSSTEEIRRRFDADVERFSNMEIGQQATIDASLAMELITRAALAVTHPIRSVLGIGCGAGNNTLTLLQFVNPLDCEEYRRKVFDYIDRGDSPRPVAYQLDLLRRVGFSEVDLLHKNSCFAAFGGKKGYP